MTTKVYDPGDIVVIGAKCLVDSTLTSPGSVVAYVTRPDGTTLNSTDDPTKVEVTIDTTLPTAIADELDVTTAQNTTGTGLIQVRLYAAIASESTANAEGLWKVTLVPGISGPEDYRFIVREPAVAITWGSTDLS